MYILYITYNDNKYWLVFTKVNRTHKWKQDKLILCNKYIIADELCISLLPIQLSSFHQQSTQKFTIIISSVIFDILLSVTWKTLLHTVCQFCHYECLFVKVRTGDSGKQFLLEERGVKACWWRSSKIPKPLPIRVGLYDVYLLIIWLLSFYMVSKAKSDPGKIQYRRVRLGWLWWPAPVIPAAP